MFGRCASRIIQETSCLGATLTVMKLITAKPEHSKKILSLLRSLHIWSMDPIYTAFDNKKVKVVVEGKKVLGAIAFTPRTGSVHIEALVVRRTNRRQGIGTKLVREVIRTAKRQRKRRVSVATAFEYNAKEFYEKCGFYRTRTWHDAWSMSYKVKK